MNRVDCVPFWITLEAGSHKPHRPSLYPPKRTLKPQFKVDDVVDAIAVIDQTGMPVDEDVAVAAWRRRQLAIIISGNRMDSVPHIAVEHISLAKPGFVFRTEPVAISEPRGGVVVVLVVPVTRDLPVVVIEPRMIPLALIVALLAALISVVAVLIVAILIVAILVLVILILSAVLRAECTAG